MGRLGRGLRPDCLRPGGPAQWDGPIRVGCDWGGSPGAVRRGSPSL